MIESVSFTGGPSVTIKSHHNVGGLPERMNMQLVEPLRELFKDEVRELGRELGLPEAFVGRHPFPGPGLAIRIPGEVTKERCDILRKADAIYLEEIRNAGLYDAIWQAFAVLLPVRTVGVMGDCRTYDSVCALRAVTSVDGMTADIYPFDAAFLSRVAPASSTKSRASTGWSTTIRRSRRARSSGSDGSWAAADDCREKHIRRGRSVDLPEDLAGALRAVIQERTREPWEGVAGSARPRRMDLLHSSSRRKPETRRKRIDWRRSRPRGRGSDVLVPGPGLPASLRAAETKKLVHSFRPERTLQNSCRALPLGVFTVEQSKIPYQWGAHVGVRISGRFLRGRVPCQLGGNMRPLVRFPRIRVTEGGSLVRRFAGRTSAGAGCFALRRPTRRDSGCSVAQGIMTAASRASPATGQANAEASSTGLSTLPVSGRRHAR